MTIGKRKLNEALARKGWTLAQAAEALDTASEGGAIRTQNVMFWRKGRRTPTLAQAVALQNVFGISPKAWFKKDEENET